MKATWRISNEKQITQQRETDFQHAFSCRATRLACFLMKLIYISDSIISKNYFNIFLWLGSLKVPALCAENSIKTRWRFSWKIWRILDSIIWRLFHRYVSHLEMGN
jgi:hypothetical protein